jgi:copper(I)-binding protein
VLDPGGLHIMLSGLRKKLVEGETIALSLRFETAGTVEIEVPVQGPERRRSYSASTSGP